MPTPTPIHINYGLMVVNLLLQGFVGAMPGLFKIFISTWYIWGFLLLAVAMKIAYASYQHKRLSKSGIFEIDKMNIAPEKFEERLQILFTNLGYKAERTVSGHTKPDFDADLVIEKDGVKTAVQAKCWKESVGERVINDIYSAIPMYDCQNGIVVTTNYFTRMAKEKAHKLKIKLWSRDDLIDALLIEKSLMSKVV